MSDDTFTTVQLASLNLLIWEKDAQTTTPVSIVSLRTIH